MMKAAVLEGRDRIILRDVEPPVCGPNEAILKVRACAVCGSDIRIYHYGNDLPDSQPSIAFIPSSL